MSRKTQIDDSISSLSQDARSTDPGEYACPAEDIDEEFEEYACPAPDEYGGQPDIDELVDDMYGATMSEASEQRGLSGDGEQGVEIYRSQKICQKT